MTETKTASHVAIDHESRPATIQLMRAFNPIMLAVLFLAGMVSLAPGGEYLKNTDLSEGFSCWHGDGEPAFLNPDGTEGQEGDKGVIPVLKLPLSKGQPRALFQEYETRDNAKSQHVRIQIYASSDFKRSKFPEDYSPDINWQPGGVWYWPVECVPNVDFWIRVAPGFLYKLASLKPGQWVTVDGRWDSADPADDRTVCFFVPPGDGTIYLRNASATP